MHYTLLPTVQMKGILMKLWPVVTGVAIALTLVACKSPTPPKGVKPISNFEASRYLGKWYEVARPKTASNEVWSR